MDLEKLVKHLGSQAATIYPGDEPAIATEEGVFDLREYISKIFPKADFNEFLELFKEIANQHGNKRNPRGDVKTKRQFAARVAEGYVFPDDFRKAIIALHKDEFHKEKNWLYADPEYVTRSGNMEKLTQRYDLILTNDAVSGAIQKMKDVYDKWNPQKDEPETDHTKFWKEQWIIEGSNLKSLYKDSTEPLIFIGKVKEILGGHPAEIYVLRSLSKVE